MATWVRLTIGISQHHGKCGKAPALLRLGQANIESVQGVGGIRRSLVMMLSRHGKSELYLEFLPEWCRGMYPDRRMKWAGCEAMFVAERGKAREVLREQWEEEGAFGVRVAKCPTAAAEWGVEDRSGGTHAAGVMGRWTGCGANRLIVDDPGKNAKEGACVAKS